MVFQFKRADQLERWKASMRETVSDRRVRRFARESSGSEQSLNEIADLAEQKLLPSIDREMRSYTLSWQDVSAIHLSKGVYERVVKFAGLDKDPGKIVVDAACGCATFLSLLKEHSVLGFDINPYSLELGAQVMADSGRPIGTYPDFYISFDPDRGFVLKPVPILEELDLKKGNLIADDITTLQNTMRVLYMNGVKADVVTFMLFGGISQRKAIEFIDLMRELNGVQTGSSAADSSQSAIDSVIRNAHRICKKDGKLILGIRFGEFILDDDIKSSLGLIVSPSLSELEAKYRDFISITKVDKFELPQENGVSGITTGPALITHQMLDPKLEDALKRIQQNSISLLLIEAIVKNE
ncbi:MAG: hypothetical protein Q7S22_07535 [Candidatus Micrarchaeota archaeon]|nr:hypothetical protein [Candidatus Micrarchaeota archaeon]